MDMDWTQALTIIASVFGMLLAFVVYLMSRMDSMMNRMDSNQKENNGRFNSLENRLTSLEAETKSELRHINQRLSNIENCVMPRKVFHFEESHKEDPEEPKEN